MGSAGQRVLLLVVTCLGIPLASAQKSSPVTTTQSEPTIITLPDLFAESGTVAVVKIVSGDTENYSLVVYKALVIQSFKGTANGDTIYFGPYIGMGLGTEYIVFLHNGKNPISPKTSSNGGYGRIRYAEIFNQGYSAMKISYECVFDGKDPAQKCDDAVRVCTDYILLPKTTPTFPPTSEDTSFGCRWVKKGNFVELLESLGITSRQQQQDQ